MEKQMREGLANEVIEEMKAEGFFSEEKLTLPRAYMIFKIGFGKIIEKVNVYQKSIKDKEKINGFDGYVIDMLGKTIGKEKMREMNIASDLFKLIDELKNYSLETELNDFVVNVDFVKNNLKPYIVDEELINALLERIEKVNEFLLKVHLKKLKSDFDNSILNIQEVGSNLKSYLASMVGNITINNMIYEIPITVDELSEILNLINNSSYNDNEVQNSVKK